MHVRSLNKTPLQKVGQLGRKSRRQNKLAGEGRQLHCLRSTLVPPGLTVYPPGWNLIPGLGARAARRGPAESHKRKLAISWGIAAGRCAEKRTTKQVTQWFFVSGMCDNPCSSLNENSLSCLLWRLFPSKYKIKTLITSCYVCTLQEK